MSIEKLSPDEFKKIIQNKDLRTSLAKDSHKWFFNLYLPHYVTYPSATFHDELFALTEDESKKMVGVTAFRGCGKSTLMTLSLPIWAIIGKLQKKFIVIIGQTQRQARQHLANIRSEMEGNELLKEDLGPFKEIEDEWGSYSLVIPNYGARITAASMEQTIRGLRHNQYRPDLIICDDVEDLASVRTKEGRDKIFDWIVGEAIPAGDHNTKYVFIGNLLHEDCLLMRFKEKMNSGELNGVFKEIPLITKEGQITWPGKFPDLDKVEEEKKKIGSEAAWQREYLLRIISDCERVIHPEWIQYYDTIPPFDEKHDFRLTATGIDLAISDKDSADYTAMVSAHLFGYEGNVKIYILPNPVNKRMTHYETMETAKSLSNSLGKGQKTWLLVEDVGYQQAVPQELARMGYPAKAVKIHGSDKRSRLALTSHLVQNATILFPKNGAELLISQLVGFGVEKHDDLGDAFSLLINRIINLDHTERKNGIWWLGLNGKMDGVSWRVKGKEFDD